MQTIEIKKGSLGVPPNLVEKTTIDLIRDCLNIAPPGGFTFQDYKKRARIENAIDKYEDYEKQGGASFTIDLEDKDYEVLKEIVRRGPFSIRAPFLTEFVLSFE